MKNKLALKQARAGVQALIDESPFEITKYTYPMVSDGFGGTVQDPNGTPTPSIITVRISHERRQVPENSQSPAGFSTNLQRYILANHNTVLVEGDTVTFIDNKNYRIGPVDPLKKFGGITGYQAPLIEESA